ncbi:MAG: M6 family metalloprotease domain-containing protein, partial [Candidatus Electrothrix sp. ATG1]|nr:M6 family metalloprotease domain-containing protein [Candidatus Electrothrix sp. ATG1]
FVSISHIFNKLSEKYDVFADNLLKIWDIDIKNPGFTLGTDKGLLEGRKCSLGNVRGLTIMVEFSDQSTSIRPAQVDALLNKKGYSQGGHLGSVRDYYLAMSSNKLDYRNDVIGPVRLPNTRAYYSKNLLFDDALKAAIEQEGLDLSKYATQKKGEIKPMVDAINFLYAGESVFKNWLWPHNSMCRREFNGVKTGLYMLTGLGQRASAMSIGTICHETGHLLCRFPDLYDYGTRDDDSKRSGGIGTYCLMGSGNHLAGGRVPAPICGYLRYLAGWVDNVVEMESGRQYDLRHGDYGTVHLHHTSTQDEYFIIENRSRNGYDKHLSSNGLSVLHCDIYGSNEWQGGTADRHYQCALLQADGRNDLEQNRNRGDTDDMFRPRNGVFFSADTRPHSREWSGVDSGLILRDLKSRDTVMTVGTGMAPISGKPSMPGKPSTPAKPPTPEEPSIPEKPPVTQQGVAEDWPRVEIPDNDPNGV